MATFDLADAAILITLGGSNVYGLAREESDVDLTGIAIPPKEQIFTLGKEWEQDDKEALEDFFLDYLSGDDLLTPALENGCEGVIYNLKKYMSLALKANPTIWNTIFCRDSEVLYSTPVGDMLRANKLQFLSQRAKDSFIGYAMSQLHRIKRHKKWLDDPPTKPSREEMGLPTGTAILNKEQVTALNTLGPDKMHELGMSYKLIEMIQLEKSYAKAMGTWKEFEDWRRDRNPARAALEAKAGYDTKHAMHLIRLLRMGFEIVTTGEVNIWRDDRALLLAVRDGKFSYEELVEWGDELISSIRTASEGSALPKEPNYELINELYGELLEMHYASSC